MSSGDLCSVAWEWRFLLRQQTNTQMGNVGFNSADEGVNGDATRKIAYRTVLNTDLTPL